MIKLNDCVFILPTHSLLFNGRWGVVKEINDEFIKVKFKEHDILFRFTVNEILTIENYKNWFEGVEEIKHVKTKKVYPVNFNCNLSEYYPVTYCSICNGETTGQFTTVCEKCEGAV